MTRARLKILVGAVIGKTLDDSREGKLAPWISLLPRLCWTRTIPVLR
jgi:hypothetical protein